MLMAHGALTVALSKIVGLKEHWKHGIIDNVARRFTHDENSHSKKKIYDPDSTIIHTFSWSKCFKGR
jgi:hypothetical protein